MKIVAVIPARLESRRLPRKVLQEICGRPLIQRVYERVRAARRVDEVLVATDSPEVEGACRAFDAGVFRSQQVHASGTDRVAEAVRSMAADVVVNVQSDEPMMDPELIDGVLELFDDPSVQMASAATKIKNVDDLLDPNVVKCVMDKQGDALYFSRAPIPQLYNGRPGEQGPFEDGSYGHKHIGVYVYRAECLQALAKLPRTPLEMIESLEQLRAQENGWKIRILEWDYDGIDVDTEEELNRVREILKRRGE